MFLFDFITGQLLAVKRQLQKKKEKKVFNKKKVFFKFTATVM